MKRQTSWVQNPGSTTCQSCSLGPVTRPFSASVPNCKKGAMKRMPPGIFIMKISEAVTTRTGKALVRIAWHIVII